MIMKFIWNSTMMAVDEAEKWRATTAELWPLWLWICCLAVLTTASAWLIWLGMSLLMTALQSIYSAYQFIMITLDLIGLSLLKTYSALKRSVLCFLAMIEKCVGITSFLSKHGRMSRRREWRQQLEEATSYQDFLKIPLKEKSIAAEKLNQNDQNNLEESENNNNSSSYKQQQALLKEELGCTAAELLQSTTKKLKESRTAAVDRPLDETAASALKYDLSGVMKRNHMTLEDALVEQSRSLAESGEYGLSATTREKIEAYYEEVEAGLEWMAESPISSDPPPAPMTHNDKETASLFGTATNTTASTMAETATTTKASIRKSTSMNALPIDLAFLEDYDEESDEDEDEDEDTDSPDFDDMSAMSAPEIANHGSSSLPKVRGAELFDRIMLIRKMKQNVGRTALMLSGGGSQTMYHLGLIRALIDADLYRSIHVISGASGGSITAALCAMNTPKEMIEEICVPHVSTDYKLTGEQKRRNIRWFPTMLEMMKRMVNKENPVESKVFRETCEFYFSDVTFEEAFQRTGKHVCISVSASRASGRTVQRLLLNHISTPHVTLASAVGASCAVPGVMAPAKLMCKNSVTGEVGPFEVDGVEWIDGSIQADLPFERISTVFNVSNYVVCQTNFFVLPFINQAHNPSLRSLYWRVSESLEWDMRNRCRILSNLGLFPRLFGQDISKLFDQQFFGNLTIVPSFTTLQSVGLKVLSNPDVQDMERYLKYGQIAAWPHLGAIRDMIRLEKALDETLLRLEERYRAMHQIFPASTAVGSVTHSYGGLDDDLHSIASASLSIASGSLSAGLGMCSFVMPPTMLGAPQQTDAMAQLQRENESLRMEIQDLTQKLTEMIASGQLSINK